MPPHSPIHPIQATMRRSKHPRYRTPVFIAGQTSAANHPKATFNTFASRWTEGEVTTAEMVRVFKYFDIKWMWDDQIPY